MTGPEDCNNIDCGFAFNGTKHTHMLFTEPNSTFELETNRAFGQCTVRILAIGGGGGSSFGQVSGGGGSGYVAYDTGTIEPSDSQTFSLIVGDEGAEIWYFQDFFNPNIAGLLGGLDHPEPL